MGGSGRDLANMRRPFTAHIFLARARCILSSMLQRSGGALTDVARSELRGNMFRPHAARNQTYWSRKDIDHIT
jgi:hypothetical protein